MTVTSPGLCNIAFVQIYQILSPDCLFSHVHIDCGERDKTLPLAFGDKVQFNLAYIFEVQQNHNGVESTIHRPSLHKTKKTSQIYFGMVYNQPIHFLLFGQLIGQVVEESDPLVIPFSSVTVDFPKDSQQQNFPLLDRAAQMLESHENEINRETKEYVSRNPQVTN